MQLKKKSSGRPALARLSKILVLAKGTAEMARNMMLFHQIEGELETEMQRYNNRQKPTSTIGKLRRQGEHVLHGKYVLLAIVILNVIDCLLVLAELMLDINYVTGLLTIEYSRSEEFIQSMKTLYPTRLGYLNSKDIAMLEYEVLLAKLEWGNSTLPERLKRDINNHVPLPTQNSTPSTSASNGSDVTDRLSSADPENDHYRIASHFINGVKAVGDPTKSREVKIVTGLHKTSISILIILVCETLFKVFCFGRQILKHKLECFDGFVVIASFIVDVVFIKGIQQFTVQEYILILAFIVPWRVIRVVNSLVVAINCHEHFRILIVYKQTKKLSAELKDMRKDNKRLESWVEVLVQMCIDAGLSKEQINMKLAQERQKDKDSGHVTPSASSSLNGDVSYFNGVSNADKSSTATLGVDNGTFTSEADIDDIVLSVVKF